MIIKDEETRTKIFACYYQPWQFPVDSIYLPIQAGKAVSGFNFGIIGDDTGDNISAKNAAYSEFTAWYWVWKNVKLLYPNIEYVGLAHYRRFFALDRSFKGNIIYKDSIPKMRNYDKLIRRKLENNDIILAKKYTSEFNNLFTEYAYCHYIEDYICMKNIIHKIYPEYDETYMRFFKKNRRMSLYCMFIARYELFNKYFEWLFPLLFEMEKSMDISGYDNYQKRVLAFMAERLLNVYVCHNKLKARYEPIYYIEKKEEKRKNIKSTIKKVIKFIVPYGIVEIYRKKKIEITDKISNDFL